MSRIIVKQLPKDISEDKLRKLFGSKGTITDIQLKYTPEGNFRQFCFIGYSSEAEAQAAIKHFNNSCIQTSRIKVETCGALGADNKPWSKYIKSTKEVSDEKENAEKVENKKSKAATKLDEIIGEHKNNPEFQEFMKAHDKNRTLWANDAEMLTTDTKGADSNEDDNDEAKASASAENSELDEDDQIDKDDSEKEKLAEKAISDLDYMKTLMSNFTVKKGEKAAKNKLAKEGLELFTIKMHNVPYEIKRQDILKFFKPLRPYSVRLPSKVHGFCYVGFKKENDMKKAMLKNKSFIKGKQVFFSDFTEKNKITKSKKEVQKSDGQTHTLNPKWVKQEESIKNEENISESGRIFFRNLAYTIKENDLQQLFEQFGPVAEVNLPVDAITRQIKGFGTVTFVMPEHAVIAFNKLDGTDFHGRMLHLIPGKSKDAEDEQNENDAGLTFKQKKLLKMKKSAQQSTNWNSLFLGQDAVAELLAKQFNTSKEKILDTNEGGSSAAVRIALGETQIVIEMKRFLEKHGVYLNAFDSPNAKRSKTIILAKNLPPETTIDDLSPMFGKFGPIQRIVLPPSGVTALIEFSDPSEARQAFKKLVYSKFKNVPLYLEWAPENAFATKANGDPIITRDTTETDIKAESSNKETKTNLAEEASAAVVGDQQQQQADDDWANVAPEMNTTLFLRNLNFKTERDTVYAHFKHLGHIHIVEIAKRKDAENPRNVISLGYGFIQFKQSKTAETALKTMQFTTIEGNQVELKRSDRILKSNFSSERKTVAIKNQTGTKILVRNIPFQAKVKEVRDIFKAFGELRSVRLPMKAAPGEETHRGFGFVDYMTKSDAKKAFEALCQSTHLYGRRLVLEWASTTDDDVHELRKRTASHLISQTATGPTRSKKAVFDAGGIMPTSASLKEAVDDDDDGDE